MDQCDFQLIIHSISWMRRSFRQCHIFERLLDQQFWNMWALLVLRFSYFCTCIRMVQQQRCWLLYLQCNREFSLHATDISACVLWRHISWNAVCQLGIKPHNIYTRTKCRCFERSLPYRTYGNCSNSENTNVHVCELCRRLHCRPAHCD
jgi:hypothetical protein